MTFFEIFKKIKSYFIGQDDKVSPLRLRYGLRLTLVVFLVLLPLYTLTFYTYWVQRKADFSTVNKELEVLAQVLESENERLIDGVHQSLVVLAQLPEVRGNDFAACDYLMQKMAEASPTYAVFGVANERGDIFCSYPRPQGRISIADRLYFQRALKIGNFSVGEYQIGRISGKQSINFGYPTTDLTGRRRVVFASLDLAQMNQSMHIDLLPPAISLSTTDGNGIVLNRYEDASVIGRQVGKSTLNMIMRHAERGLVDDFGIDGTARTYALERIDDTDLYARVGYTKDAIAATADTVFKRNIFLLILFTVLIAFVLVFTGKKLILQQIDALREIDQEKSEFVSLVAHQFRTPLTSIRWNLETLISSGCGKMTKKQRGILDSALHADILMSELVDEFLSVSRIDYRKVAVTVSEVNISSLAQEVIRDFLPQINVSNLKLITNIEEGLIIRSDTKIVRMAMQNLLSNAIKYTPRSGTIEVSLVREGAIVRLSVKDSGYGIPKAQQKNIFSKMFRADNIRAKGLEGTGLGLYIVKSMLEKIGSEISFVSEENKGSTFFVRFATII